MKKILAISLILALVMALVLPTAVVAAKPFSASGIFTAIDEGNVSIIGTDPVTGIPNLFEVVDRHIQGEFIRSVKGESNRVNGPFTITYSATVTGSQAGIFEGVLEAKSATFSVSGISYGVTGFDSNKGYRVDMAGTWTGVKGIKGSDQFTAYFYFIPVVDEFGVAHVGAITESYFYMGPERQVGAE